MAAIAKPRTALALLLIAGAAAQANLISSPDAPGTGAWGLAGQTQVGAWSGSDGACAYIPQLGSGFGRVWQYIPAWKLPTTQERFYFYYGAKKDYSTDCRATINIYGLRTAGAVSGAHVPGGVEGVDYELLAGAPHMSFGNGFWWSSEYYKWDIRHNIYGHWARRQDFPHGLLVAATWSGSGRSGAGAGMDDFVLQAATRGRCAGDPLRGSATGRPHQFVTDLSMGYTGPGIDTPIWIDPEWAIAYEYEMTGQYAWYSGIKAIELIPLGDDLYDIDVWDDSLGHWQVAAEGVEPGRLDFAEIAPGRTVRKFRVRGVDYQAEIDPDGHGFPIGVLFTNGGWDQQITMTAITPEPASALSAILAAAAVMRRRRV